MSKVFKVQGYFNDDGTSIDSYLITDIHGTPEGYEDEDIFFYGLPEDELMGDQGDFTITSYVIIEENYNE